MNVYSVPFVRPLTVNVVTFLSSVTGFAKVPAAGVTLIFTPLKSSSAGFFQVKTAFPFAAVTAKSVTSAGAVVSVSTSLLQLPAISVMAAKNAIITYLIFFIFFLRNELMNFYLKTKRPPAPRIFRGHKRSCFYQKYIFKKRVIAELRTEN